MVFGVTPKCLNLIKLSHAIFKIQFIVINIKKTLQLIALNWKSIDFSNFSLFNYFTFKQIFIILI